MAQEPMFSKKVLLEAVTQQDPNSHSGTESSEISVQSGILGKTKARWRL